MNRSTLIRLSAASATGGVAGLSVVALVGLLGSDGVAGCPVATGWGLLVPIVAGLFVGGAAWGFFASRDETPPSSASMVTRECPECGGTILGDWRLCPHCGSRIPGAPAE